MLRHVVVWSMKEGHEGELDDLLEALHALPRRIEEIKSLSAGRLLNSSEFDGVLCVDVEDSAALERYRTHPAHQPVLAGLRAAAAALVVADYDV